MNCGEYSKAREGQYQIGSYRATVLMIALVTEDFKFDSDISFFLGDIPNEIKGEGYKAGGKKLVRAVPYWGAFMFEDITWKYATFTARGVIVYEILEGVRAKFLLKSIYFNDNKSCVRSNFTIIGGC